MDIKRTFSIVRLPQATSHSYFSSWFSEIFEAGRRKLFLCVLSSRHVQIHPSSSNGKTNGLGTVSILWKPFVVIKWPVMEIWQISHGFSDSPPWRQVAMSLALRIKWRWKCWNRRTYTRKIREWVTFLVLFLRWKPQHAQHLLLDIWISDTLKDQATSFWELAQFWTSSIISPWAGMSPCKIIW